MSTLSVGKQIDIDTDDIQPGSTLNVYNFLNNDWKIATVQEVDTSEREILVDYQDGSQEWICVDTRKICFPGSEDTKSTELSETNKDDGKKPTKNKRKISPSKDNSSEVTFAKRRKQSSSKSMSSRNRAKAPLIVKPNDNKKVLQPSTSSSSFIRLQFKNQSTTEPMRRKRGWNLQRNSKSRLVAQNKSAIIPVENENIQESTPTKRRRTMSAKSPTMKIEKNVDESTDQNLNAIEITRESVKSLNAAVNKKIKTLLPKRSMNDSSADISPTTSMQSTPSTPATPLPLPISTPSALSTVNISLNSSTTSSTGFVCPKVDCKKQVRNERMLLMHMKHYHPEYKDVLSSTPNVADLAYARTIGENIELMPLGLFEKLAKFEEDRLKEKNDGSSITQTSVFHAEKPVEQLISSPKAVDKSADASKQSRSQRKSSKKSSDSTSPSSHVSVLVAQLQEPPLVPAAISIKSKNTDLEFSISHSAPATPGSPHTSAKLKSIDKSCPTSDNEDKMSDGGNVYVGSDRRLSNQDDVEVVNCSCGYNFPDGLMIQCDLCMCWQHGVCCGIADESELTEPYRVCDICLYPRRQHASKKYAYTQNWIRMGIMPSFDFAKPKNDLSDKRKKYLEHSYELLCHLTDLKHAIRCVQVKNQILRQTPDHPKLYLWAQSWDERESEEKENRIEQNDGPVPEVAISREVCRKHLSKHIEEETRKAEAKLIELEGKVDKLIDEDEDEGEFGKDFDNDKIIAKRTLLMMMRDLTCIQNLKFG